jgi:hypothetical protein
MLPSSATAAKNQSTRRSTGLPFNGVVVLPIRERWPLSI